MASGQRGIRAAWHQGTILVRADGGGAIGAGHVMRCLALAQAWQDAGGSVHFAAAELSDTLRQRLADERVTVIDLELTPGGVADADATVRHAKRVGAAWVVADGYGFGEPFQRSIKDAGLKLLVIDDYGHADGYHADLVLNQNLDADPSRYQRCRPATRLLLGTKYALLRREFVQWGERPREIPDVARHLLVSFGGSDPHELAAKTIRAIHRIVEPVLATTVVAGSQELQARLASLASDGPQRVEVLGHVSEMPGLMARADLAIAAAGSASWERALLRLPSLVITAAENQRLIAEALHRAGAALDLGWWHEVSEAGLADSIRDAALDAALRRRQADAASRLVDGRGSGRILEAMMGR